MGKRVHLYLLALKCAALLAEKIVMAWTVFAQCYPLKPLARVQIGFYVVRPIWNGSCPNWMRCSTSSATRKLGAASNIYTTYRPGISGNESIAAPT